jgi:hypothetical protein
VEEDANLCHGDTSGKERRQNHEMKPMNPNQISFVKALDDDVREVPIHCGEGCP